jgi:hypothetical protein
MKTLDREPATEEESEDEKEEPKTNGTSSMGGQTYAAGVVNVAEATKGSSSSAGGGEESTAVCPDLFNLSFSSDTLPPWLIGGLRLILYVSLLGFDRVAEGGECPSDGRASRASSQDEGSRAARYVSRLPPLPPLLSIRHSLQGHWLT